MENVNTAITESINKWNVLKEHIRCCSSCTQDDVATGAMGDDGIVIKSLCEIGKQLSAGGVLTKEELQALADYAPKTDKEIMEGVMKILRDLDASNRALNVLNDWASNHIEDWGEPSVPERMSETGDPVEIVQKLALSEFTPYGVCPRCGAGSNYPEATRQDRRFLRKVEKICKNCGGS